MINVCRQIACTAVCLLFCLSGCWYSPWESLTYEAVDAPDSHWEAMQALSNCCATNRHEACVFDGVMCSVMLRASGYYMEEHGPYTLSLGMVEIHDGRRNHRDRVVRVKRVAVKMSGSTLWRQEDFQIKLDRHEILNSRFLASGYGEIVLPDILDPKDGRMVEVEVAVERDNGEDKTLDFKFRPKVESGKIRVLSV